MGKTFEFMLNLAGGQVILQNIIIIKNKKL